MNFKDIFKNNERNQDFLKKISEPLKRSFGIDVFWHVTVHENGQLSGLCNYNDAFCHFWENHWYNEMDFFISPAQLNKGYFLLEYDMGYDNYMQNIEEKYPLHHPFLMIRKEKNEKADLFGFSSKKCIPALPSLYINNLPLLNSYIDYFLDAEQNFKIPPGETMVDMATLRGKDIYYGKNYGEECLPNRERNFQFLNQIGVDPFLLKAANKLTPREKQVLVACLDGKTAAENGEELGLSPRTIQSYIENIKNRLGILTREELMKNGHVLKMAGFLN